jgi:hypothetical protein
VNFFLNNFNEFYEDHGIKRLLTMPRFPQQKDMVEKNNRRSSTWQEAYSKPRRCLKSFGLKL